MNYYQNSNSDCCCMQHNNNCHDNSIHICNHEYRNNYCINNVEKSICCYPSYYNEDNSQEKDDDCLEGFFKLYPKQKCEERNLKNNDSCKCKQTKPSCFCGCRLFRW